MQRCEEVASLQSQVSQEKELRTVMEGCLMEDKMAWRRVHGELVENHRLAQDMNATLAESRACRSQLLSRLTAEEKKNGGAGGGGGWRLCLLDAVLSVFFLFLLSVIQSNTNRFLLCSHIKMSRQIRAFRSW